MKIQEKQLFYNEQLLNPIYRWSSKQQQWINCLNEEVYQEKCWDEELTTLTFNVLYDQRSSKKGEQKQNVIYSSQRYDKILEKIGQEKPTLATFNEVTTNFIKKLQLSQWARKHYYISQISKIKQKDGCFGNMIISLIKPHVIHSLKILSNQRKVIFAFFKLPNKKMFSLSSLHLSCFVLRRNTRDLELNQIVNYLKLFKNVVDFHLLQGDFNFQSQEQLLVKYQLKDLWSQFHDLNLDPGYTFDAGKNMMVNQIYWGFNRERSRLDRILILSFEKDQPLTFQNIELCFNKPIYCQEKGINYMGRIKGVASMLFDMFSVNAFRNKEEYLFYSDHFGVQSKFKIK